VAIRGHHRSKSWDHRSVERHSPDHRSTPEVLRRSQNVEEQLGELRQEHDHLRRALFEAAQVQRKLCGTRHLLRRPYEIASEIFPVHHVSGDFVIVQEIGTELVLAIGDICGKGLAAGMWFAHVVGTVRMHAAAKSDPAAAMSVVNDALLRSYMDMPFTSLLLCRLSLTTGEIKYCNAGHPPGLLLDEQGSVEMLTEGGPLLAAVGGASYKSGRTKLKPGATMLGFSDGVIECGVQTGDEFGVHRVLQSTRNAAGSAAGTLFSLFGAVEDFAGNRQREDDLALLVVHRDVNA